MPASLRSSRLTIDRKSPAGALSADAVEACRRGEARAWDALVEQYSRLVYSIPRRYGLDESDADDVVQAVFLSLFQRLDSIRDPDRLCSWLITTAHRESWRIGKRSGYPADLDDRIADAGAPSDERMVAWESQHLVRLGLQRLGGRCEDLLTALFADGAAPNYGHIAARLGMKVGSIGPTRARCFAKLEKILLDLGLEVPPGGATEGTCADR